MLGEHLGEKSAKTGMKADTGRQPRGGQPGPRPRALNGLSTPRSPEPPVGATERQGPGGQISFQGNVSRPEPSPSTQRHLG